MARETLKRIDAAVVVSDLHCGSVFGLCPPQCPLLDDGHWGLNEIQDEIWDRWCEFKNHVQKRMKGRAWALVINGDATEGMHHGGKHLVHADPGVHARIAVEALAPLAKHARRVYQVIGTECHVQRAEYGIGEALGAVRHPDTKQAAAQHWLIRIQGCLCSFKHHIGTSGRRALQATQLSIQLAEERLASVDAGGKPPDFVVRSHRHTFGHWRNLSSELVTTPAWQALTPHAHKVVPSAVAEIGGVILDWKDSYGILPSVDKSHVWAMATTTEAEE